MAVSKTSYGTMYATLEGTLSEVMTQLQTDAISLTRCQFIYDAGNSKVVCVYT